jgi:hypothetical protein
LEYDPVGYRSTGEVEGSDADPCGLLGIRGVTRQAASHGGVSQRA